VDLCAVFRLKPIPPPGDRLPPEEEQRLESYLAAGGVRVHPVDGASAKLAALRTMYEPYVQALSDFLIMSLPDWVPATEGKEPWHTIG
jgi:hypothetical protein